MPSKANKRLQHAAKKAAEEGEKAHALVPGISPAPTNVSSASANDNQCSPSLAVSSGSTAHTPNSNKESSPDITQAAAQMMSLDISDFPSLGSPSQHQESPCTWGRSVTATAPTSSNVSSQFPSLPSTSSPLIIATPGPTSSQSQEWKDQREVNTETYTPSAQLPRIVKSKDLGIEILTTNSYKMIVRERTVYRYNVLIWKRDVRFEKEVPLVGVRKGKKKEGMLEIIQHALKKANLNGFVGYDGAAILFAVELWDTKEIQIDLDTAKDRLPDDFRKTNFSESHGYFRVVLKLNESESGVIQTTGIFDEKPEKLQPRNRTTMNMVQLAMTQDARDLGFITTDHGSQLYNLNQDAEIVRSAQLVRSARSRAPGIVEATGLSATMKIAEGQKKMELHLVLDSKHTLFFKAGPLGNLQPFQSKPFDIKFARSYLKDLHVETVYSFQNFNIENLSEMPIEKIVTGDGTSLAEAAAKRSGRKVSDYNLQLPAVETKFLDKETKKWKVFSHLMENLKVVAGQKVSAKHHPPPQAARPNDRCDATKRVAEACRILPTPTTQNEKLAKIGMNIDPEPIVVEGIICVNPTVHYRNNQKTQPNQKASWNPIDIKAKGGFMITKKIENIIIAFNSNEKTAEAAAQVEQLREALLRNAWQFGMEIKSIEIEDLAKTYSEQTTEQAILKRLESLMGKKTIFIYADGSDKPSHGVLKLGERRYEVVTQHLALDKSLQKIQRSTITNIFLKLNVKAGGHNHRVSVDSTINNFWGFETSKTLLFSYDVCHASGKKLYSRGEFCSEPSCVGFGFNGAGNSEAIIGDFHYQEPRKEQVNGHILKQRMRTAVLMFAKHRGFPKNIVVIRDGVSEGQYAMVVNYEQMAILEGIEEAWRLRRESGTKPALAIIVATKRHDNRLFKKEANGEMKNARHLTVVDHTIVRQNLNEMIFLSHCPVLGTAQPILLNVLVNNGVFKTKEQIVKLITALCTTHQSSSNIISLPDTVFAADQYAKRGADIFSAFKEHFPNQMKLVDGKFDFEAMTRELCYDRSDVFRSLRIT